MPIMPIRVLAEERREEWHTRQMCLVEAVEPVGRERGCCVGVVMLTTRVLQTSKSLLRVVADSELFVICGHGDGVRLGLFCGRSSEKRG